MPHWLNISIIGLDSLLKPHTLPESDKPFDSGLVKMVELGIVMCKYFFRCGAMRTLNL